MAQDAQLSTLRHYRFSFFVFRFLTYVICLRTQLFSVQNLHFFLA